MNLNIRANHLVSQLDERMYRFRIERSLLSNGATVWDFGVHCQGGIEAGIMLARICMSDLAEIGLRSSDRAPGTGASLQVVTDHPVAACMASQYAGWQVATENYFGMGSGPMRAAAGSEDIFTKIGMTEAADAIVGVLESGQLPNVDVTKHLADGCQISPNALSVLVAPTSSQAGNIQIVARSVETAMHKLFELGFDIHRVRSGFGSAPLPPVAKNDLAAIGRTNDAILYGANVTLWVDGDDESLQDFITKVPSSASKDFGRPFREIFEHYDRDFYKIDPHLFSPAQIQFCNLETGSTFSAGQLRTDLLQSSFLH